MNELSRFVEGWTGKSRLGAYLEDDKWSVTARLVRAGLVFLSLIGLIMMGAILTRGVLIYPRNIANIGRQGVMVITAAAAMVFLFAQGSIDFSFLSVASLSSAVFARLLESGTSLPAAILAGTAVAIIFGLMNGIIVGYARIPGILVTAMTGILAQTAVNLILRGETVMVRVGDGLMGSLIETFSAVSWIVSLAVFALAIIFAFTPRFMGRKPLDAGRGVTGLRIGLPYLGSGALAGLAGIYFAFRLNAASPMVGHDWAHEAFFILFFSGAIFGNRAGNPVGILIAALYLVLLENAMSIMGLDIFLQTLVVLFNAMGAAFYNLGYEALVSYLYKKQKAKLAAAAS